ncbi:hypothetical protein E4T39_01536 [Aureobasidium subglaciale]|nr:hypothetical protein E4T39_01536 [Aureobasidium subglaciale]
MRTAHGDHGAWLSRHLPTSRIYLVSVFLDHARLGLMTGTEADRYAQKTSVTTASKPSGNTIIQTVYSCLDTAPIIHAVLLSTLKLSCSFLHAIWSPPWPAAFPVFQTNFRNTYS